MMAVLTDKTLLYLFKKIAGYAEGWAGYKSDEEEDADLRQDAVDMGKDFQRVLDHASWAIGEFEAAGLKALKEIDERVSSGIYRGESRNEN